MASSAMTRGAAYPRQASVDKTRLGKFKMFLWYRAAVLNPGPRDPPALHILHVSLV